MYRNNRKNVFKRTSSVSTTLPRQEEKTPAEKCIHSTFSLINAYLWVHVIGFTPRIGGKGKRSLITTTSIIIKIFVEANFLCMMFNNVYIIVENGFFNKKAALADSVITIGNAAIRFLFYNRRKSLKNAACKLARISAEVSQEKESLRNFRVNILVMLFINDALTIFTSLHYMLNIDIKDKFFFALIPDPYSIPSFYISCFLYWLGCPYAAFTAYFCFTCFLLRRTLKEIRTRLSLESEKEHLFKLYEEITDVIVYLKDLLQPFLLTVIIFILIDMFLLFYLSLFAENNNESRLFYLRLLCDFTCLVLICKSSCSVIDAATRVQSAAMKVEISNLKSLQLYIQASQGIPEFKILNSIVVDSSLILSSLGALLTYGILFATFSNSKKDQDIA